MLCNSKEPDLLEIVDYVGGAPGAAAGAAGVAAAVAATAFGHLLSRLAEFAFTVECYVASFPMKRLQYL